MSLIRISNDPLSNLLNLQQEIERFFDRPLFGASWSVSGRGVFPPVNMFEQDDALFVIAELPGLDKDQLDLQVHGDSLTLKGERQIRSVTEGCCYHRRERSSGQFRRVINLPYPVDAEKTNAAYTDGVLVVRLEKAETAKPRRIQVQTNV